MAEIDHPEFRVVEADRIKLTGGLTHLGHMSSIRLAAQERPGVLLFDTPPIIVSPSQGILARVDVPWGFSGRPLGWATT